MHMKLPTNSLTQYDLEDLKLVYRVLHHGLTRNPDLMDSRLLADLQEHLHATATAEGVDATDHRALDAWMGNSPVGSAGGRSRNGGVAPFPGRH